MLFPLFFYLDAQSPSAYISINIKSCTIGASYVYSNSVNTEGISFFLNNIHPPFLVTYPLRIFRSLRMQIEIRLFVSMALSNDELRRMSIYKLT